MIYFIQEGDDGPVKIGFTTKSVTRRLQQMQVSHSRKLNLLKSLPGNSLAEKAIHEKLSQHRLNGEWFVWCNEVKSAIDSAAGIDWPEGDEEPAGGAATTNLPLPADLRGTVQAYADLDDLTFKQEIRQMLREAIAAREKRDRSK